MDKKRFKNIIKSLFSVTNDYSRIHKVITILGIKIKIRIKGKSNKTLLQKFKKILRQIFSVTNSPTKKHKVITILGTKIKFRKKGYALQYLARKFKSFIRQIFSVANNSPRNHKIITILGFKIKKHIKGTIEKTYRIFNKKIGDIDAEIVHIMANNVFTTTYYNMLRNHCDISNHLFICYRGSLLPIVLRENNKDIIFGNINTIKFDLQKVKKIILHGLLEQEIVDYFYEHPKLLKKCYWSIWGSDLYKRSGKRYDYVRKNVKAVITHYDYEQYKNTYGDKPVYNAYYLNPLSPYLKQEIKKKDKDEPITILINQCCTVKTIEALEDLSKFKDENIKIITPLSYIRLDENITPAEIIAVGKRIYGDKYQPLTKYIAPKEYSKIIESVDVMVVNLDFQGALGNLTAVVRSGGKAYLKSTTAGFQRLTDINGLIIYPYEEIKTLNFKQFIKYPQKIKKNNVNIETKFFSEEFCAKAWGKVFEGED